MFMELNVAFSCNSREYFGEKIGLYFAWLGNLFNS